jgi:iron complex transport system ATP-binding protein
MIARLQGVSVRRSGAMLLDDLSLDLPRGEHLAVLGPNGAGKTTLLRILSTYLHPTAGEVEVLGARFGRVDLRTLRSRIGVVSVAMQRLLAPHAPAADLVAAARSGQTSADFGVGAADRAAARGALARVGADHLADRICRTLSQGEWQRVQIARALVTDPDLLLLDEPFAGLDLGGREAMVADLSRLLGEPDGPTVVLVTHHLEEIPVGVVGALLLRGGRAVASGAATDVLTSVAVSAAFGVAVAVGAEAGRYTARVRLDGGALDTGGRDPLGGESR